MANQQKSQQQQQPSNLVKDGVLVATIAKGTFGAVEFSVPDGGAIYDNKSGKSTTAVQAKVPLASIGLSFAANVYGDLGKDGLITFRCSLPKGITGTESVRDEFKRHLKAELGKWAGFKRAATLAHARLTAVKGADNPDAPLVYDPAADVDEQPAESGAAQNEPAAA